MAVGFLGLGNIGQPMAEHLLQLEEPVWVYDVMPGPMAELESRGARVAATPAELAAACAHIGICVRDDADVEGLLQGPDGLLAHARPDSILAIHSTVTQASVLRWAEAAAERGLHLLDAPISGGAEGARQGSLCYMVGADEALLERCRKVFMTSAARIVHAGPLGTGIALKLCNNLMSYLAFAAIHEAGNLAEACGLDLDSLKAVGEANGVVTPQMWQFLQGRNAVSAQGPEALKQAFGGFARLGEKDLQAALASGEQLGLSMPATRCVEQLVSDVFLKRY